MEVCLFFSVMVSENRTGVGYVIFYSYLLYKLSIEEQHLIALQNQF